MADHPEKVGIWRLQLAGRADFVDEVGHTANDAFRRARQRIAKLLEREPILDDVRPELIADNCLTAIVEQVAKAWELQPNEVLVSGHTTRQRREARTACLLIARERFGVDAQLLAEATGWPVKLVGEMLKFAEGRGGRGVRERVSQMGAAA